MYVHTKFKRNDRVEDFYFINPLEVMTPERHTYDAALRRAAEYSAEGRYVILALSYEAESGDFIIGVFDKPVDRGRFLEQYAGTGFYRMGEAGFLESRESFMESVGKIREYIKEGHTYQVNYTTRLGGDFEGDPHGLFQQLTAGDNGDYAMFITWEGKAIVSCSPELFFEVDEDRHIRTRPMKGTSKRHSDPVSDGESFRFLKESGKDRAENVMIVDLLRNDLSKVAKRGTVSVPHLFTIEKYETVYQMTSTVEAKLADEAGLPEIMKALFPCGSITGAPKMITMDIIEDLESTPRGFYCGTLGIMFPGGASVFNVPIRTLYMEDGRFTYGAGGGITYDSDPAAEYEEMVAKTRFLASGVYRLIETMSLRNGIIRRFDLHESRIRDSAAAFSWQAPEFKKAVLSYLEDNGLAAGDFKLRAEADSSGRVSLSHATLEEMEAAHAKLAAAPIIAPAEFLRHKTTVRHHYDSVDDEFPIVLYYNENHRITEFNIGSLVVEEAGTFHTPPLSEGLLGGVMRRSLMRAGVISERSYTKEELVTKYAAGAVQIYMINSLREWVKISLDVSG
ncbi:aminodeoxychorismate synthase component I [Salinicoccus carnicancri]|uniref:aminodeoxychorismate synthase component I n=1 Tax=Salinicoccus carnicancri TaxID=558170 RepID=UPI000304548B|nr:aminodeoxychorismate synthase component I [Salinicoccus carnicancri]